MQRISTLDGWRGVGILLVVIDHFMPFRDGVPMLPWLCLGTHGVTIFFVLSGYLITRKLLEEHERTGRIDLRSFYVRRIRRLMPCAWLYLLFVWSALSARELLASVLFFRNYFIAHTQATLHFWSLSLEEQFYLLWPGAMVLFGVRRARWVALICGLAVACFRYTHWNGYTDLYRPFHTEVRADALLVGCVFAFAARRMPRSPFVLQAIAAALLVFCTQHYRGLIPLWESVLIGYLIVESLRSKWGNSLNVLSGLGLVSYSVYVWQQAFAIMVHHDPRRLPYACLLVPVVWLSYTSLERPFMRPTAGAPILGDASAVA